MKIELFKLDEQFSKHCLTQASRRSIQRALSREYNDIKNSKFNYQSQEKNVQMLSLETFSSYEDSAIGGNVSDLPRKKMLRPPSGCATPQDASHGVTISRDISASRNSQDMETYEENIVTQRSITAVSSRAPVSDISDPTLGHGNGNGNIDLVKWMENAFATNQQLMKTVDSDEIKTFLDEFREKNVSIEDLIRIKHDTVAFQNFQNGFTSSSFALWLIVANSISNL